MSKVDKEDEDLDFAKVVQQVLQSALDYIVKKSNELVLIEAKNEITKEMKKLDPKKDAKKVLEKY